MTTWRIWWDRGDAEIQLLRGMVGKIRFRLDDARKVQPMARHLGEKMNVRNAMNCLTC